MSQFHFLPPILPYLPISNSTPSPSQPTLTLSLTDQEKLLPYLPPTRTTFLREGPHPTSQSTSTTSHPLPHLTLTYATSLDSTISLSPGVRTTLSGAESKAMTHFLRANHDAILIGAGTANVDDPGLNTRFGNSAGESVGFERQPRPVVLDPGRRWCGQEGCGKVFGLARSGEGRALWWIVGESETEVVADRDRERLGSLRSIGGDWIQAGKYKNSQEGVEWEKILTALAATGVRSVMVEGGATVINDLLRERNQRFLSSVIVTIAPTYLGSGGVVVTPPRTTTDQNEVTLGDVVWVPFGRDIVMASRITPKS